MRILNDNYVFIQCPTSECNELLRCIYEDFLELNLQDSVLKADLTLCLSVDFYSM